MNEYPKILETFKKNKPSSKTSNLYLCEVVDMDGNVIETKVGKNLLTNQYGLPKATDDILSYNTTMVLGNGYAVSDPDNIDPTETELRARFTALGKGSNNRDNQRYIYPIEYDSSTHILSQTVRGYRYMWDYTAGDNQTYEATEFGLMYYDTNRYDQLYVHGRIYDEHGNLSSITKQPNTRLYITAFFTYAINVDLINQLYQNGKYLVCSPLMTENNVLQQGYGTFYAYPLSSGHTFNVSSDWYPAIKNTWNDRASADNGRSLVSSTTSTVYDSIFYENNRAYCTGFGYGEYPTRWSDLQNNNNMVTFNEFFMFSYNELPAVGYDSIKNIESNLCVVNMPCEFVEPSTKGNTAGCVDITNILGTTSYTDDKRRFVSEIPASQFDISSLYMYNYDTKDWDIPVNYQNAASTRYNNSHWKLGLKLKVTYSGNETTVCVFVNPYTNYSITGFSNTGISMVATDSYWDVSSWVTIPNLSSIPAALQNKRYYIITSKSAESWPVLSPIFDQSTRPIHKIIPRLDPFELTDNGCPLNKEPQYILSAYNSSGFSINSNTTFRPIASDIYEYFFTNADLVYYDIENKTLKASYPLIFDNETYPNQLFRYKTADEDRIIVSKTIYSVPYSNPTASNYIFNNYGSPTNEFRIWKVGAYDVTPTYTDITVSWSTPFPMDTSNNRPLISFSDEGYICIQRYNDINEGVFIDVYNETQHIISSNCHKLWALNKTSLCVYQDLDETSGTDYVFRVYDMSTQQIVDTFHINDGKTYTIHGVIGWKNYIYIQTSDTGDGKTTFMYNTMSQTLTATTLDLYDMLRNDRFLDQYAWQAGDIYGSDEIFIIAGIKTSGASSAYIRYDDPTHRFYPAKSNNYSTPWIHTQTSHPQVKRCINGHLLAMLVRNNDGGSWAYCMNLGDALDNGPNYYPTNQMYLRCGHTYSDRAYYEGCAMLYKDGIIHISGIPDNKVRNRIFYIPIESMTINKITGTTDNINAYNNPVRFSGLSASFKITSDLNRIINGDT